VPVVTGITRLSGDARSGKIRSNGEAKASRAGSVADVPSAVGAAVWLRASSPHADPLVDPNVSRQAAPAEKTGTAQEATTGIEPVWTALQAAA
jgi:hypothetical protein